MWLEVRSGLDAGRVVELPTAPGATFVLGRVKGADYVVRDERASRRHLQLRVLDDGRLALEDLGSANGTLLDGEAVERAELAGGEELRIGDVVLRVTREAPRPEPAPVAPSAPVQPDLTYSMVGRLVAQRDRPVRIAAFAGVGLAVLAVVAVVLLGRGGDDDPIPGVVKRVGASTVRIDAQRERGTGFVTGDGVVVTNAHVVNGGLPLTVNGKRASLVGVAPCADLAVVRTDTAGLEPVRTGGEVRAGETVVAVGFPAGSDGLTSTRGVVSAPATTFADPAPDVPQYEGAILTDTALNPGNSGGPLADSSGRVIGVNAAARTSGSDGRPLQGQNYALSLARSAPLLARLRAGASPGWVGTTFTYPSTQVLAERKLPAGLFVASVLPGTPAAAAGVRAGDLITAAGGRVVSRTLASWCAAVGGIPVPSLTVIREGRTLQLRLTGDR